MKQLFILILLSISLTANAEWVGGIGKTNLTTTRAGLNVQIDGLEASLGHKFNLGNHWSITPKYSLSRGIESDHLTFAGVGLDFKSKKVEIFSVRGQYDFNDGVYFFTELASANFEFDIYVPLHDMELGYKEKEKALILGVGYHLNELVSIEYSAANYEESEISTIGLKFNF